MLPAKKYHPAENQIFLVLIYDMFTEDTSVRCSAFYRTKKEDRKNKIK